MSETSQSNEQVKRLYRSEREKIVAGVAGGLAEYFEVDPTLVRLIFIGLAVLGGSGLWIYLVLWMVIPRELNSNTSDRDLIKANVDEIKHTFGIGSTDEAKKHVNVGLLFLVIGLLFLFNNFDSFGLDLGKLWPIVLIVTGFVLLYRRRS